MKKFLLAAAIACTFTTSAGAQAICDSHKANLQMMDESLARLVDVIVRRAGRPIDPHTGKPEGAADHDKVTIVYANAVSAFNRQRDDIIAQMRRDGCPL